MQLSYYILFLLSRLLNYYKAQISTRYTLSNRRYIIEFDIGDPFLHLYKTINQGLMYSHIFSGNYDKSSYSLRKIRNEALEILGHSIESEVLSDNISFLNERKELIKVDDFLFYFSSFLDFIGISYIGGFAFGFNITDQNYSLTHLLYNSKKISELSYAFQPTSQDSGILYFGTISNSVIKYYPYHSSCNVVTNRPYWGCTISKIEYGTLEFIPTEKENSTNYIYFNSAFEGIHFPDSFLEDFYDYLYVFGRCTMFNLLDIKKEITCQKAVMILAGNITFTIGDYEYTFNIPSLFDCGNNNCYSVFMTKFEYGNDWVFGVNILNRFMTIYDYKRKTIQFLSKENNIVHSNDSFANKKRTIQKGVCIGLIFFMGISYFLLAWNAYKIINKNHI